MRRLHLVGLSILLMATFIAPAHANGAQVVVSLQPNGEPAKKISLTIVGSDTSTSGIFYVRQEPVTTSSMKIRLLTQLTDEAGQQVSGASVAFTAQEPISGTASFKSVDATTTGVMLPEDGTPVQVTVTVTNLQKNGKFTGAIIVYVADTPTSGPTLEIERMAAPQLAWVGAVNSAYTMNVDTTTFDYPFQIESLNATITKVSVLVDSFVGSDGVQIKPEWQVASGGTTYQASDPFTLPGLLSATVRVTASLPLTGTYHSGLTLIYNDQRQTTTLTVARDESPLPVKISGIETAPTVLGPFRSNNAEIWFNLTSTDVQGSTIVTPTLATLSRVGADGSLIQATYDSVSVTLDTGASASPLILPPVTPKRVLLTVLDLEKPGEYRGTLRLIGADAQSIERPVKILARDSWLVAAFFIFLGILVSGGIRFLAKTVRPKLRQQMKLRLAIQELESQSWKAKDLVDAEKDVLQSFGSRLRSQYALATMGEDKNTDDLIKEINAKLPLFSRWVELRLRIDSISPAELQGQFRKDLAEIGRQLARSPAEDSNTVEAQIEALKTSLDALALKISERLKAVFLHQVEELQNKLRMLPDAPAGAIQALDKAKALATEDKLSDAHAQFNTARRAYLQALIRQLTNRLAGTKPAGFKQQEWDDLKQRVQSKVDAAEQQAGADLDRATELFEEASADYLRQAVHVLRRESLSQQTLLTGLATEYQADAVTLPQIQAASGTIVEILSLLDDADVKIEKTELGNATTDYDQAQSKLPSVVSVTVSLSGKKDVAFTAVAFAAALLGIPVGAAASVEKIESSPGFALSLPSIPTLRAFQVLTELLLGAIALAAAVVLGLNLLYFTTPTWGGGPAYVLAVLWGLGLHQAAGQTFDGLTKFIEARSA